MSGPEDQAVAPVIAAMSHLALRVRDLDAALDVATRVMGMREVAA